MWEDLIKKKRMKKKTKQSLSNLPEVRATIRKKRKRIDKDWKKSRGREN